MFDVENKDSFTEKQKRRLLSWAINAVQLIEMLLRLCWLQWSWWLWGEEGLWARLARLLNSDNVGAHFQFAISFYKSANIRNRHSWKMIRSEASSNSTVWRWTRLRHGIPLVNLKRCNPLLGWLITQKNLGNLVYMLIFNFSMSITLVWVHGMRFWTQPAPRQAPSIEQCQVKIWALFWLVPCLWPADHIKTGGHIIGQERLSVQEIQQYFTCEIRKGL